MFIFALKIHTLHPCLLVHVCDFPFSNIMVWQYVISKYIFLTVYYYFLLSSNQWDCNLKNSSRSLWRHTYKSIIIYLRFRLNTKKLKHVKKKSFVGLIKAYAIYKTYHQPLGNRIPSHLLFFPTILWFANRCIYKYWTYIVYQNEQSHASVWGSEHLLFFLLSIRS